MFLCLEGPEGPFNTGTVKEGIVVDFSPFTLFRRAANETQGPRVLGKYSATELPLQRHGDLYVTPSKTVHHMATSQERQMTQVLGSEPHCT